MAGDYGRAATWPLGDLGDAGDAEPDAGAGAEAEKAGEKWAKTM